MENEHILGGLIRKRADIAGDIAVCHDRLRALQADLAHVEATMRLFQPDIDFSGARVSRRPGPYAAEYGDMSRAVRGVLRDATGPMTVTAIAAAVIAQRGLQDADQEVVRKRVGSALRNFKRRGQATSRHGRGLALEWTLVET